MNYTPLDANMEQIFQKSDMEISAVENNRYHELKAAVKRGAFQMAEALREIRERNLYRAEYPTFEAFVKTEYQMSDGYARRLIRSANTNDTLVSAGVQVLPTTPHQVKELAKLGNTADVVEVWNEAVDRSGGNVPSGTVVPLLVKEKMTGEVAARVAVDEDSETITPDGITLNTVISAAAECMGGIDLDPTDAANEAAHKAVKKGISEPWGGRVFLVSEKPNTYLEKLIEEYELGNVQAAIYITRHDAFSTYALPLSDFPRCHLSKPLMKRKGLPFTGQMTVYGLGVDVDAFIESFVHSGLAPAVYGNIS